MEAFSSCLGAVRFFRGLLLVHDGIRLAHVVVQIAELKNKDIARYREKGKILALQAAREKAQYLLEAAGKRLGDILFIIEPDENGAFQPVQYLESNLTMLSSAEGESSLQGENTVKIKLHYRMRVRFQIADYLQ